MKQENTPAKTTTNIKPACCLAITFFAAVFGVSTAKAQLSTPLISLGFNENSGSSVTNTGLASATFSKTAPPAWSTNAPVGGGVSSVDFATTTGNYYVESGDAISQLAGMTNFTVTGWVNNRSATIGSGGNRIVSWIKNGGNGVDIVYASGGTLKVGINQWPDTSTAISSTGMIPTDAAAPASNWRFFAVTYNASTSTIQIYFGGNSTPASLDKSLTYNMGVVGTNIGKLAIGHFNAESSRTSRTDRMFRGLIDQVQIFGTVLSLSEIQTVQNVGGVTAPVFNSVMHSGSDIVLSGTNGPANGAYQMLRSVNPTLPTSSWPDAGIKSFDGNGNFNYTNPVSPGDAAWFYRLRVISTTPLIPPGITGQPQDQAIQVSQNATFNVTATGTSPLTYLWYYNTNTLLASGTSATLTITNAQVSDSGKISVTVSNLLGTTNSVYANLSVTNNTQPPFIVTQPASNNVTVGQTANFSVTATGASPLSYQWYYNTNTVLEGKTNSTLSLVNVQLTNAGQYSVTITNPYGSTNSVFATLTVNTNPPAELLAFPEAEGYGKYTVGGRGGVVYQVTNLNDSGAGSLRAAVEASGPRTVVFQVSGTITLTKNLTISNPYITIAGQTAPGDGICLKKYTLNINADQVIIRYIRVRYGDELKNDADAISMRYRKNIILDHVSASWGDDETLSLYHGENITVQWCLISETLNRGGDHGFAGIWGSQYSTFHHNLVAHCVSRNMRFASGCGYTDYRNNVIYNWGYNSAYGAEANQVGDTRNPPIPYSQVNIVNNYYKPGPATESGVSSRIVNPTYRSVKTDYGQFYVAGNHVVGNATVTADNWNGGVNPAGGSGDIPLVKLNSPWPAMAINQQTAQDAYASVLAHVGCSKPARDSVDARIISETTNGTATYGASGIIESQTEVGGWPTLNSASAPTDTDHDGMPDDWETAHGLNPDNAADRNSYTLSPSYTNLEVYLNELGAF